MQKRGQSAVEFVILISALLLIIIPVFFVLTNYAIDTGTQASDALVKENGRKIVDEAREIFYLGTYSKEIITYKMPDNIRGMESLIIVSPTKTETYLFLNYTKGTENIDHIVPSEVPIISGSCTAAYACFAGLDCYKCQMDALAYKRGITNIKLETIPNWNGMTVVNISSVTW